MPITAYLSDDKELRESKDEFYKVTFDDDEGSQITLWIKKKTIDNLGDQVCCTQCKEWVLEAEQLHLDKLVCNDCARDLD